MRSGIYRIDLGNGWFYIGSSVDLNKRQNRHRCDLQRRDHGNSRMQRCWNKYGIFDFTILETCETSKLLLQEQVWIDKHYSDPKNVNLTPTAGSNLGIVHSVQARANMTAAGKGYVRSVEHRLNNGKANKGKIRSAEARAKMSSARKRRVITPETCAKLSKAGKGRVPSAETRARLVAAWVVRRALVA
jgi:group I intron endonuclease